MRLCASVVLLLSSCAAGQDFDGGPWNISTGNVSVSYIQHSPIGAAPLAKYYEAPPAMDWLVAMKKNELVADEDYVAWGAVEREPGKWDWTQHDRIYEQVHKAGLKYVVYVWAHFPPVWLREKATQMKCLEHGQTCNYLSIFDPKTIEYYDHFYHALHDHFGDKIDDVYACILGPYGEGNYPLLNPDWVNMGHCHEGYWCGDEFARRAFREAMRKKYNAIEKVNLAWGMEWKSFDDVVPPKAPPGQSATAQQRRRWLDFIAWYHQAIIDFAEQSIRVTLKYFPKEKVRTKPGGNAGGVNPIAWGTYCPGYAKMAGKFGIVLQPADFGGAVFGDKWVGTAYQFYHVPLSTEPASTLDRRAFLRRIFSDACCGASQFFTYEFDQHVSDIHKHIHLLTGEPGETAVAVYCPTTLYRLGGNLQPTITGATAFRDAANYDVLDELLISDGALSGKYKILVMFQSDVVEQSILDRIDSWCASGGTLVMIGDQSPINVEGKAWKVPAETIHFDEKSHWRSDFIKRFAGTAGVDTAIDGVWTMVRGKQMVMLNTSDKPVTCRNVMVAAHEIAEIGR